MAQIQVSDLPTDTVEVFRRRARAAATPLEIYVRQELIALARRRTSVDTIVEFLESQGRDLTPEFDLDALTLIQVYDLPADALGMLGRRARAAETPLGQYMRAELVKLARRGSVLDSMLEFRELQEQEPTLELDMGAIAASVRYARGE
ncbi:hypothetical protein OG874_24665 [Nocardia sp. NBC_00565]|uniref:hypothetical protein n=1 Tax=Nocardia sp. NBC_00565 TaxID=2975993 RepID=UPI002E814F46|nr:hypothetical protein [Nocardia sp. NBC_00565]WUC00097.1 hypothetical protein OG874_24665 [Nocardia sp. NBC_00565]